MITNKEKKIIEQSMSEQKGIRRRRFIKTTGLAAVGLGAGHITKVK